MDEIGTYRKIHKDVIALGLHDNAATLLAERFSRGDNPFDADGGETLAYLKECLPDIGDETLDAAALVELLRLGKDIVQARVNGLVARGFENPDTLVSGLVALCWSDAEIDERADALKVLPFESVTRMRVLGEILQTRHDKEHIGKMLARLMALCADGAALARFVTDNAQYVFYPFYTKPVDCIDMLCDRFGNEKAFEILCKSPEIMVFYREGTEPRVCDVLKQYDG